MRLVLPLYQGTGMESLSIVLPYIDWTPLGIDTNKPYHFIQSEGVYEDFLIRFEPNRTYRKNNIDSENKAFCLGLGPKGAEKIHIRRLHIISNAKFLELYSRTSPDSSLDYLLTVKSKPGPAVSTLLQHNVDSTRNNGPLTLFEFQVDEELHTLSRQGSVEIMLKFLSIKQLKSGHGEVYFHLGSMEVEIGLLSDFAANETQSIQSSMNSVMIGMLSSLQGHTSAGVLEPTPALMNNSKFATGHSVNATGIFNKNNIDIRDKHSAYNQTFRNTTESVVHSKIDGNLEVSNNTANTNNSNTGKESNVERTTGEIIKKDATVYQSFKETNPPRNESCDYEAGDKQSTAHGLDAKELASILWSVKNSIVEEVGDMVDKRLQPIQSQLQRIEESVLSLQRVIGNNDEGAQQHEKESRG